MSEGDGAESRGHALLEKKLKTVLQNCKIVTDREVQLNISGTIINGKYQCERSIDVVGVIRYKGKKCLLFFECKDVSKLGRIRTTASSWVTDIQRIKETGKRIRILGSLDNTISSDHFNGIDDIKLCYVFGNKIEKNQFQEYSDILSKNSFIAWDASILRYYEKISETLGEWTRYELYREFQLNFETMDDHSEQAVEIRQSGFPPMYLMGIHPGLLLKIGYVLRRTSGKPSAYQRMLNKDRIARIAETIKTRGLMLPNAIVVAFDNEESVQKRIGYNNSQFRFPLKYCSAWIIDGQHRVFGFLNTNYSDWDDTKNDEYKLPVVAFKSLEETMQNRSFVSINYFQKKINPTLLCDLAAATEDLSNELAWPSLLGSQLNKKGPMCGMIKISELDGDKPITLSSFARYGLLESLLGFNKKKSEYNGPLFKYAPFNRDIEFRNPQNSRSFNLQHDLLSRYFASVRKHTEKAKEAKDPWRNWHDYSLVKTTGINALFLVLKRIMDKHPKMDVDLDQYMKAVRTVNFARRHVAKQGGGWTGFRNLANEILRKLNRENAAGLQLYSEKEKT